MAILSYRTTYPIKVPLFFRALYPGRIWRSTAEGKSIYLSFDDGPTPGVTESVLEKLDAFGAKATFFCLGKNVEAHPSLFDRVKREGHGIGNHGYEHLNGRKNPSRTYCRDVEKGRKFVGSPLFRPPYGRLKARQARKLSKEHRIVMWDVLSGDFDQRLDGAYCAEQVIRYSVPGSIVLFHDSQKARERVELALPQVLEHFHRKGYSFFPLPGSRMEEEPDRSAQPQ